MDTLSKAARRKLMSRIRSANTSPELVVRACAKTIKRNFQVNSKRLSGSPDLAFFRLKRAILVHGCFWHQHKHRSCNRSNLPKSNQDYWIPKLARNVQRDKESKKRLRENGWSILVIWECECRDAEALRSKLATFLKADAADGMLDL
jgi:DNA mismatch endonuclease (patch repair protein)